MVTADPPKVTPEQRAYLAGLAERELCKRSFVRFLSHVQILTDDPINPRAIPFEPYPYQVERAEAWEGHASEVIGKARQLGFSWLVAAYMVWRAMFHGWAVGYYSRGEKEARHQIKGRVEFVWKHLPRHIRGKYTKSDTLLEFADGGSILAFPGTEDAGVGYTFQLIVADECAFHAYGAQNYAAYRPTLSAGAQFLAISTADPELGPSGFFWELYTDAEDGLNGYDAVFVPWYARPERHVLDSETREVQPNAWWYEREKRAYKGMPDSFPAFYPGEAGEMFIGRQGLVFHMFSEARHVRESDPVPWESCIYRYASYDLGGGDPTAIVILGLYRAADGSKKVHQYDEFYKRDGAATIDELYQWLLPWHTLAPFWHIEPDPVGAAGAIAQSLRSLLGDCVAIQPKTRDAVEKRNIQAMYLENDWLSINAKCKASIREFSSFRWRKNTDPNSKERYAIGTPVNHHGDAIAARGQAIICAYYDQMNQTDGRVRVAYSAVNW